MLDDVKGRFLQGVENLLFNCAGCVRGDKLLIVHETEHDGYFDPDLAPEVTRAAQELGLRIRTYGVPFRRSVADPDADLIAAMDAADCTVFFARLGDQNRFRDMAASKKQIISYALDCEMLASSFGSARYQGFETLKYMINAAVAGARDIHVTCPDGTDFRGTAPQDLGEAGDVTRKRFPVSVFAPVPAHSFRGRIAQRGFLTGTGSHYYQPYVRGLADTLFVEFDGNRITGFDGSPADVAAAREHYEFVGNSFGIDTYHVHSWHIGIHPGCTYAQSAATNFERWSGAAFGNPRLLHFHTCGAYPPGEISLNVLDPTVRLDGVALWRNGRLRPEVLPGGAALLNDYPDMRALFDSPCEQVGQGSDNRLCFA